MAVLAGDPFMMCFDTLPSGYEVDESFILWVYVQSKGVSRPFRLFDQKCLESLANWRVVDGESFFEFKGYEFGDWHRWIFSEATTEIMERGKDSAVTLEVHLKDASY